MHLNFVFFSKTVYIFKGHSFKSFKYGFKFTKNGKFSEIFTNEESDFRIWKRFLGLKLVQKTFHEDFEVTKMLGQGNFSKAN